MKAKKTPAKKVVKPKAAAKPVAKKSAAAKKPAPSKGGLIKKLTNALKGKPAKSVAKKTPTAAKPAARPAPKKIAKSLAGKANVQNNRSEEHTSELKSHMRLSYAVFCLKKKTH